jgi:phage repressor protein C with HTH and peptisase S24 domain
MDGSSVRDYLDRLIRERGDSYDAVSRLLGRNPAYIQQFVKRGTPRRLDERDRGILARYFGIAEEKLGGPAANRVSDVGRPVVVVPRLALGASAGAGSLDQNEEAEGALAFDPKWLRGLGVRPERLSIIRVDGESMMPTLGDGDDIMVDRNDGSALLREGIYVLRMNDVLMVKRVAPTPLAGHFSIRSDNSLYASWESVKAEDFSIVGRVIWVGRRVG